MIIKVFTLGLLLAIYSVDAQTKTLSAPFNLRWGMPPSEVKDSLEKRNGIVFNSADTAEFGVITQRYSGGKFSGYELDQIVVRFYSDSLYDVIMGISYNKNQSELVEKLINIYKQLKKKYSKPNGNDQVSLVEKWRKNKSDDEIWEMIASYSDYISSIWYFGIKDQDNLSCFIPDKIAKILAAIQMDVFKQASKRLRNSP